MKSVFSKFNVYRWLILVLILVFIVLINVIGHYTSFRFDMTEDQRYSLSPGTEKFLKGVKKFDNRISIKIYLDGELPSELRSFKNSLEEKLKDFKNTVGNRIEYTFINPNVGSEKDKEILYDELYSKGKGILPMEVKYTKNAKETKMMLWPGAVLSFAKNGMPVETVVQLLPGTSPDRPFLLNQMPDVVENGLNNLEYNLVSALRRLTTIERKKIAFLQGHGELNDYETRIAKSLIAPYYFIENVTIDGYIKALDDYDALIIADPKQPFSEADLFTIDQFVMKGGDLMCFMNTLEINKDTLFAQGYTHSSRKNLRLEHMLFDYGFKINDNLVMDVNSIPKYDIRFKESRVNWYYQILATNTAHPITKNIEPVAMEFVNQIEFTNKNVVPILTTSSNSNHSGLAPIVELNMAFNFDENNPKLNSNIKNKDNQLCIAALAEGKFNSYSYNRVAIKDTANPNAQKLKSSKSASKIFVIGNGEFMKNSYRLIQSRNGPKPDFKGFNELKMNSDDVSLNVNRMIGNQDFFLNIVDYMMGNKYMLDIRSKQIDVREIDKEKVNKHANYYKLINLVIPISIILLTGIIIGVIRRIRFTK
jgi:ABC-2 type transport system permease protein